MKTDACKSTLTLPFFTPLCSHRSLNIMFFIFHQRDFLQIIFYSISAVENCRENKNTTNGERREMNLCFLIAQSTKKCSIRQQNKYLDVRWFCYFYPSPSSRQRWRWHRAFVNDVISGYLTRLYKRKRKTEDIQVDE